MSSLEMKFPWYQAFLFIAAFSPIFSLEMEKISDGVDHIFLKGNITTEESIYILKDARESYQTLTDFTMEKHQERKKELMTKLSVFMSRVIDDLTRTDMTLRQLFRNVNMYLKGAGAVPFGTGSPTAVMPVILKLLDDKIAQQLEQHSKPIHYDIKRILSTQDDTMDSFFRRNESITPTTIGFFFLEAFATIFGLSWGIISMILSDFQ